MLNETQTMLSVSALEVLANDQTAAVAAIGEDRVSYFINLANNTGEQEFRDILRDFKAAHKDDKVAGVRASEFQTLFYGNLHNATLTGMGYHAAVANARKHLEGLGLRTNGKPILSEEEKEANREKNLRRKAANEAAKLVDFGDADAIAKLQELTAQTYDKLKADKEAESRVKKFEKVPTLVQSIMGEGQEYAEEVWMQLSAALGYSIEEETEEQQKAA